VDHFRPINPSSSHWSSQANLSVRHRRESEAATPLWSPKCACGMKQSLGVYNWNVSLERAMVESDWAPFRYTIYGILSGSLVDSFWFLAACDRIENDSYCSFWFTFQVATVCAARRCQNQTASDRAAQSVADMGPMLLLSMHGGCDAHLANVGHAFQAATLRVTRAGWGACGLWWWWGTLFNIP